MKMCTTLSEDPESPSLNTKPHASDHCAVDGESLAAIDSQVGRQVLASLSPEQFGLYTVTERIGGVARAAHVGSKGLARLAPDASPLPMPEYDATLERDFTGRRASALRVTEEFLGDDTTGLRSLVPHGGLIEVATDVQARSAYTMLVRQGSRSARCSRRATTA